MELNINRSVFEKRSTETIQTKWFFFFLFVVLLLLTVIADDGTLYLSVISINLNFLPVKWISYAAPFGFCLNSLIFEFFTSPGRQFCYSLTSFACSSIAYNDGNLERCLQWTGKPIGSVNKIKWNITVRDGLFIVIEKEGEFSTQAQGGRKFLTNFYILRR